MNSYNGILVEFPSPLGVSYFQIWEIWYYWNISTMISVPSRGILFPNKRRSGSNGWKGRISVPSRGILFPNIDMFADCEEDFTNFRPLSGYLISKSSFSLSIAFWSTISVPSRGILFPNDNFEQQCFEQIPISVPSRGILFPNTVRQSPLFYWLFWLFCVANHFPVYFSYI